MIKQNKKKIIYECCLCQAPLINGFWNPTPLGEQNTFCCENCYHNKVLPERLRRLLSKQTSC